MSSPSKSSSPTCIQAPNARTAGNHQVDHHTREMALNEAPPPRWWRRSRRSIYWPKIRFQPVLHRLPDETAPETPMYRMPFDALSTRAADELEDRVGLIKLQPPRR